MFEKFFKRNEGSSTMKPEEKSVEQVIAQMGGEEISPDSDFAREVDEQIELAKNAQPYIDRYRNVEKHSAQQREALQKEIEEAERKA